MTKCLEQDCNKQPSFNLPTKKNELVKGSGWFDIATSGGESGIELIKGFIKELFIFLKND